jgi:hypothetical protein
VIGMSMLCAVVLLPLLAQEPAPIVAPLTDAPADGIEKVWGDPAKPGEPFVIRIHREAGHIVFPHTHPVDENIVVVKGSWAFGMGKRFDRSTLRRMEVGDYGMAGQGMAHFGWSQTDTVLQVHGIGPFTVEFVDPVYELTDKGVLVRTSLNKPAEPAPAVPPGCFGLSLGTQVRASLGEGVVVGGLCSPANELTLYSLKKPTGGRFWAAPQDLIR